MLEEGVAHRHCHGGDGGWVGVAAGAVSGGRSTARRVLSFFALSPSDARSILRSDNAEGKNCLARRRHHPYPPRPPGRRSRSFFCTFPADVGPLKGLFAACRRVAAHIFVVHTIVAKIGAIAGRSDELGDVALDNPCTVTAVCGFQDPYGIEGLFLLCGDTAYLRTKDHEDD